MEESKTLERELLEATLKHMEAWKENGYTMIKIDDVIEIVKETLSKIK